MNKNEVFRDICNQLADLYEKKNNDYGDSFAHARKEVPYYTLGRLYDKFNRYKNLTLGAEQMVNDESVNDTLRDLACYALMEYMEAGFSNAYEIRGGAGNKVVGYCKGIHEDDL